MASGGTPEEPAAAGVGLEAASHKGDQDLIVDVVNLPPEDAPGITVYL